MPVEAPGLECNAIFREPFLLASPAAPPCERMPDEVWRTLPTKERLLLHEGHCLRHQALAFCSDVGSKDRHSTSLETLKYMVAAGEGMTLIPALATETGDGVHFSPLPAPDFARDIALVWRRGDARAKDFEALSAALRDIARGLRQVEVFEPAPSPAAAGPL
jgi:LysR family hydrogen peroxide-inducible transcriptional activator